MDLLDYRECPKVVENTFIDLADGRATNRPRTHTYSPWKGGESMYGFVSYVREGVTSALAANVLSRADSRVAGLFGTGQLARSQIPALCLVRPIEKVYVYSPNADHRRAFCKELQSRVDAELIESSRPRKVVELAARRRSGL